jgi:hypothetical protein
VFEKMYAKITEKDNKSKVVFPRKRLQRVLYILQIPLTHLQWLTIANPLNEGKKNFYPLTLLMSCVWIWAYTYCIVWWTYQLTISFNIHFSIIPMLIYPFGISIRDRKKFIDFKKALQHFEEESVNQDISLAESYSS